MIDPSCTTVDAGFFCYVSASLSYIDITVDHFMDTIRECCDWLFRDAVS